MGYTLVIVESAGKIKKIQSYLGDSYKVCASYGHIRKLDKDKFNDMVNQFKPYYKIITRNGKSIVSDIKKLYDNADDLLIASDLDREGEQIAESIADILKVKNPKRIVFTEITQTAILNAVKNPRTIDKKMVESQQTRSLLDIIVGFKLSPLLWQNIASGLSAGRVQSVVVKLVVDRENEIESFKPESYYKVVANFLDNKNELKSVLHFTDKITQPFKSNNKYYTDSKQIENFYELLKTATFNIYSTFDKLNNKNPSPPFITSTLQQEAGRKFGFTSKRTMDIAQKLYEGGYITYMRTDSVALSKDCIDDCKKFIVNKFGNKYSDPKQFDNKNKNSQEAHEAIRPTYIDKENIDVDNDMKKLYTLIWKRTVASQMASAKIRSSIVQISITHNNKIMDKYFETKTDTIEFDGFLSVYNIKDIETDDEENIKNIPTPKINTIVKLNNISAKEDITRPTPRFNEASLVKKLEDLSIGRPSTYATMISIIQEREYVKLSDVEGRKHEINIINMENNFITKKKDNIIIGKEIKKLIPTNSGKIVTEYLNKNFPQIMDYKFTANMEESLDNILDGSISGLQILKTFYEQFNETIKSLSKSDNHGKLIGLHPTLNLPIYASLAKFGPVVKIMDNNKIKKIASLEEGDNIDNIKLDKAIELLKYPYELGEHNGKVIEMCKGKFGYYISHNDKQYKTDKEINYDEAILLLNSSILGMYNNIPITIQTGKFGKYIVYNKKNYPYAETLDDAIKNIQEKDNKIIKSFTKNKKIYNIINGKFGPCIMFNVGKTVKFVNIPKNMKIDEITMDQIDELIKKNNNKTK